MIRESDIFKREIKKLNDMLIDKDLEVDNLQTKLQESESRLRDVLKTRGLHDNRATLDSNFPSAIEMQRNMQEIPIQTLKNLVDCWLTNFDLYPATLAFILKDLFAKCNDFIEKRFERFDVQRLIRISIEQRLTLEQCLRQFRILLFELSEFDETEECKIAIGKLLDLDWISWAQNFSDFYFQFA